MEGPSEGKRATIVDVARLAGVSTATVSKAVNGKGRISDATQSRIADAARTLGWAPSASAVALRGARSRTIGIVARRTPDLLSADPYYSELISGVEQVLAPAGYGLLLQFVGSDTAAESQVYRRLAAERRVDGVILTESRTRDPRFALLRELGLPAVLIGTPRSPAPIPWVAAEGRHNALREAATHLLELGHRQIAYVSGPQDRVHTGARLAVVTETLAAQGVPLGQAIVADFTAAGAITAVETLLGTPDAPTAILFANDMMAAAGISAARRSGVDVPGRLSVVGYDDLPIAALLHPALTTIRQDLDGTGRSAASAVLGLLDEDHAPAAEIRPPTLVVRESTGPAPERGSDSPRS
ncbi:MULTISPECIES: LacI family DNA-binding transcriptional regulator [unclassified Pseudonocardia]|uniref:LacI family DNA-binding transcriptional regulator n=1 Tax=unclassified Pseudonocardia TaxID=2619320 RepID=UPI00094AFAB0|nr:MULTISPECIES: LacI family DNA-binding transcriptional regulator [unclassified Pseudonocardia]